MKILNILLVLAISFFVIKGYSQQEATMQIYKTKAAGGDTVVYKLTDIDSITFTPCKPTDCGIVIDYDGNNYNTVVIGTQCWMKENLKVTHYRNGDSISHITNNSSWAKFTVGAWCNYNNNDSIANIFGRLYNWYAVDDSRGLCPSGWHVPSDKEWQTLVVYLGDSLVAGGKLKEAGTTHWQSPNTGASNESGFTALPGGHRHCDNGLFRNTGDIGYWWSATEFNTTSSFSYILYNNQTSVLRDNTLFKSLGYSVRCLKD